MSAFDSLVAGNVRLRTGKGMRIWAYPLVTRQVIAGLIFYRTVLENHHFFLSCGKGEKFNCL